MFNVPWAHFTFLFANTTENCVTPASILASSLSGLGEDHFPIAQRCSDISGPDKLIFTVFPWYLVNLYTHYLQSCWLFILSCNLLNGSHSILDISLEKVISLWLSCKFSCLSSFRVPDTQKHIVSSYFHYMPNAVTDIFWSASTNISQSIKKKKSA